MLRQARGDARDRWAFNFLADPVTEMESERKARSYIASNVKAVKSWLSHNGIEFKGKLRIRRAHETPSLATKHTPSLPELGRRLALIKELRSSLADRVEIPATAPLAKTLVRIP